MPGDLIVSAACFGETGPDVWRAPEKVNFLLRDLGAAYRHKNITESVHLYGLSPLIRYWVDFVPMGFVAHPEPGIVYLDTGNAATPGIVDHHFEQHLADSACELLVQQPELLREHVTGLNPSRIEFRLHTNPDLDCAASLYAAQELLETQPRHALLAQLAAYVSSVDQARIPNPHWMSDSLYGIFKAHQILTRKQFGGQRPDRVLLESGLRVIDAALFLMEAHPEQADLSCVFRWEPAWFLQEKRLLQEDLARYNDDLKFRSHTYTARVNGLAEPVTGLWLDHPQSIFFRIWGWTDPMAPGGRGYPFLAVDFSQPGKQRFVIGVNPESKTNLNGLGQLLERHENQKRKILGKERPVHPIRLPSDNSDPWYFGQGHNYAVVDAPGQGTVLTAEEVQRIHEEW